MLLLTVPRYFRIQSVVYVVILWTFHLFTFSANIRFTSSESQLFAVYLSVCVFAYLLLITICEHEVTMQAVMTGTFVCCVMSLLQLF